MSTDAPIRVGVDVGGTFTKAVAVRSRPVELLAQAVVPTTHSSTAGVTTGVAEALERLFADLGPDRERVALVAFSTTQAMNALLEGDVARVGVVGIGAEPELRKARKRTSIGDVKLAPGRVLQTEHAFLDATGGLEPAAIEAVLGGLERAGCEAVAVSGAFAVDAPEHEQAVVERARARGLAACAGHELTGTYGLEVRTTSAAINASILPVVERTAAMVEGVMADAGLDVPLLVLQGDGGAMSLESFRRAPSRTIGSGPAAGVAAALHQLGLTDAIVLECGGTSSNVSVVKNGRAALRTLRVLGRLTAIRSIDSWVVGAAGGSMPRVGRRRVDGAGPRSAHVAGLPYSCFAGEDGLAGAQLDLIAPRAGDPADYATVAENGDRWALTATCAARALDSTGEGRPAALAAFAPLGERMRRSPEQAAAAVLDQAVDTIAAAVAEAAKAHGFGSDVPVVALGGAGRALAPRVADRLGRPCLRPEHPEVLSSIGAALSLVRVEESRQGNGSVNALALSREAERACVAAGAAPQTVAVETSFDAREGLMRAVATGAVALEAGAGGREPLPEADQRTAAAAALGTDEDRLSLLAANDFYRVFCENGAGLAAVVDGQGSVPLAETTKRVLAGDPETLVAGLAEAIEGATVSLGVASLLPRAAVVCGARIVDLSDAHRSEEMLATAREVLDGHEGTAVALIWS